MFVRLAISVLLLAAGSAEAQTKLVVLGTGTPNPDPIRSGPAVAIVVGGSAYLVDAGPGIVRRAAEAARDHQMPALSASSLGIVFITHLHSDHTVGLPDLVHTGWVAGRAAPLRVFGPPGIDSMAHYLTAAWSADIAVRTDGTQPSTPKGWQIEATVVAPGMVYRDSNVTVTAIPVPHSTWKSAFGYRFQTKDRTIVVSGDTRGADALVTACNGCDVLIHEVYSLTRFKTLPAPWQQYHRGSHVSTVELAAIATKARPKLLVLYHQLYWGATDEELITEIRQAGYRGAVVSARDLGVY